MSLPSTTFTEVCNDALTDIGVVLPGQGASADILTFGRRAGNRLIDLWLLNQLLVFAEVANIYPMVASLQQYQIGPGQVPPNFDAPRPTRIDYANCILNTVSPVQRLPIEVITDQQWAAIRIQQLPNAIPYYLYYDGNFDPTSGFATINIYPGPQLNYGLELYTWQQLRYFPDLTTGLIFPPGYQRAIQKNLAVELISPMSRYQKFKPDLNQVRLDARTSLAEIKSYNAKAPILAGDPAFMGNNRIGSSFNWLDGEVGRGIY